MHVTWSLSIDGASFGAQEEERVRRDDYMYVFQFCPELGTFTIPARMLHAGARRDCYAAYAYLT